MNASVSALPRQALLTLGMAMLAAGLLIGLFLATKAIIALIVGGIVIVSLLLASGNQRLFCLWAVVVLAPFSLGKHFALVPHMGGAGSFSIEPIDPFMLMLIAFMLRDFALGYRTSVRLSPVLLFWGGMIVLGLFNAAFSPMRIVAAEEVVRMAKCYLLFFVIINEVVRVKQFMHLLAAVIFGIALQSCAGMAQGIFKISLGLQALGEATQETIKITSQATYAHDASDSGFRINGLLGHPNLLAAYLAMLLPLCVALLFSHIPTRSRILLGGVTAVGAAALLMTLSRSGWLSFGIAAALLFGLSFVHPRLRRRFLFARVAAIAFAVVIVISFSGAIVKRLYQSDPSAINFRYEWMEVAFGMVEERPVLGFGLNTFVYHLPGRTRYGGVRGLNDALGRDWPAVHNVYLLTWSEQGTLGFACFVGLHLYLLWIGIRNVHKYYNDVLFAVNLGCLCGIVSLLIDGIGSFYIRNPAPARTFWIFIALMVAVDYWNKANAPRPIQAPSTSNASAPAPLVA